MARDVRRAAWQRGRWAEGLAVWLLRAKGYRILARDWRSPVGEIDIVARRGTLLAMVEVKRRADAEVAAWSVTPRQQRRIARAAEAFRARLPDGAHLSVRFDVLLVAPRRWPRHILDAWRL